MIFSVIHILGIFTVPVSGTWRVRFNVQSMMNSNEEKLLWVYLNSEAVSESLHKSYNSNAGQVTYTGGREIVLDASEGDTISLRTTTMQGIFWEISMCLEYQPN